MSGVSSTRVTVGISATLLASGGANGAQVRIKGSGGGGASDSTVIHVGGSDVSTSNGFRLRALTDSSGSFADPDHQFFLPGGVSLYAVVTAGSYVVDVLVVSA